MAKFIIRQYRDACVTYTAEVEAETAEDAFAKAQSAAADEIAWVEVGVSEYDNGDACVEDENGNEVLEARQFW